MPFPRAVPKKPPELINHPFLLKVMAGAIVWTGAFYLFLAKNPGVLSPRAKKLIFVDPDDPDYIAYMAEEEDRKKQRRRVMQEGITVSRMRGATEKFERAKESTLTDDMKDLFTLPQFIRNPFSLGSGQHGHVILTRGDDADKEPSADEQPLPRPESAKEE